MNSSQLDLFEAELSRLPWRGQSPRALTRVQKGLFSRREPQKNERFFVDQNQIDMFPAAITGPPWKYRGAPLLVSLDRR